MKARWTHSNKAIYNIGYHLIWCSKYRRKVIIDDIKNNLEFILFQKALGIDIIIENLEIQSDHVHLFVKSSPVNSPHYIVQQLKGYSSRILRNKFKELLKMPSLWTRSYYCESVGHISEKTIKKYIENQKNK